MQLENWFTNKLHYPFDICSRHGVYYAKDLLQVGRVHPPSRSRQAFSVAPRRRGTNTWLYGMLPLATTIWLLHTFFSEPMIRQKTTQRAVTRRNTNLSIQHTRRLLRLLPLFRNRVGPQYRSFTIKVRVSIRTSTWLRILGCLYESLSDSHFLTNNNNMAFGIAPLFCWL